MQEYLIRAKYYTILLQKMDAMILRSLFRMASIISLKQKNLTVTLENVFSDAGLITCGVPQGSISGPLLFLIYIYIIDLPQALHKTGSHLYAHDTCIFSPSLED